MYIFIYIYLYMYSIRRFNSIRRLISIQVSEHLNNAQCGARARASVRVCECAPPPVVPNWIAERRLELYSSDWIESCEDQARRNDIFHRRGQRWTNVIIDIYNNTKYTKHTKYIKFTKYTKYIKYKNPKITKLTKYELWNLYIIQNKSLNFRFSFSEILQTIPK